jgi:threonine synthase
MVAPVGDGPTLVALDRGFGEVPGRRPRLLGVQAAACQPLVQAWLGAQAGPDQLDPAGTVADGIAVLRPAIGDAVLDAIRGSGGAMVAVDDSALLGAVSLLAARAGVGAEPAGAAALAGLRRAVDDGTVDRQETVVLLVTGRELTAGAPPDPARVRVAETLEEVERQLAGG